jgi:hypothetical protein
VKHASTKGSRRVKLHREFVALIEDEMSGRGTTVVPSGEQFGKWAGLRGVTDREIVWPPMVIVMNTLLEKDYDDDKVMYFSAFSYAKPLTPILPLYLVLYLQPCLRVVDAFSF